jgi:hypothetical protein
MSSHQRRSTAPTTPLWWPPISQAANTRATNRVPPQKSRPSRNVRRKVSTVETCIGIAAGPCMTSRLQVLDSGPVVEERPAKLLENVDLTHLAPAPVQIHGEAAAPSRRRPHSGHDGGARVEGERVTEEDE